MKKFFDGSRMRELKSLEELYERNEFTFAVVYGRRRIGKRVLSASLLSAVIKKRFTLRQQKEHLNIKLCRLIIMTARNFSAMQACKLNLSTRPDCQPKQASFSQKSA